MKKKLLIVLTAVMLLVTSLSLVACDNKKPTDVLPKWAYDSALYTDDATLTEDSNLRIMSYNVLVEAWNSNRVLDINAPIRSRVEQASKMLNYYLPDVVGLQEVCEKWHKYLPDKISENYTFVDKFAGRSAYTSMIYNHKKVTLVDSGKQMYKERKDNRMRYAAWAVFKQNETGKQFAVINTHFDFGKEKADIQASQMKEYEQLGRKLQEDYSAPVFLLGDYNAYEKEVTDKKARNYDSYQAVELFNKFKEDCKDVFVDANYVDGAEIIETEITNRKFDDSKWDHIFVSKSVPVKAYGILSSDYYTSISDHFPIFVDVVL